MLLYPVCYWSVPVYFSAQLSYSSALWLVWYYFLSLLTFSLCSSILLSSVSMFWPLLWTVCQVDYLHFIEVFSSGFCLILLYVTFSSFFILIGICFYVLCETVTTSPCLDGMALCKKWTLSFNQLAQLLVVSQIFLIVLVVWFVLDRSLLLRVCQDMSVFKMEWSHPVPSFRLIGSQFFESNILKKYTNTHNSVGPQPQALIASRLELEVFPGWQVQELRLQRNVYAPFWEWAVARPREGEKMVSPCPCSYRMPLHVWQIWSLYLRLKLHDK